MSVQTTIVILQATLDTEDARALLECAPSVDPEIPRYFVYRDDRREDWAIADTLWGCVVARSRKRAWAVRIAEALEMNVGIMREVA